MPNQIYMQNPINPSRALLTELDALKIDDVFCLVTGAPLKAVSIYYQVVEEKLGKRPLKGSRYLPAVVVPDTPKAKGYRVKEERETIELKHGMVYLLARPGQDIHDPSFEEVLQDTVASKRRKTPAIGHIVVGAE